MSDITEARTETPRVVDWIETLRPAVGDVILVHLAEDASDADMRMLAGQLSLVAQQARAALILLPTGVTVESIDEREMLVRGWLKVGPIAHTAEQLDQGTSP